MKLDTSSFPEFRKRESMVLAHFRNYENVKACHFDVLRIIKTWKRGRGTANVKSQDLTPISLLAPFSFTWYMAPIG